MLRLIEYFWRFLPAVRRPERSRVLFFGAMVVLTAQMMQKMESYMMTIIDVPMNVLYGICLFGFAMMTLRSIWITRLHWRRGYSVLERPESSMDDR